MVGGPPGPQKEVWVSDLRLRRASRPWRPAR
jgi:hypothetical protein